MFDFDRVSRGILTGWKPVPRLERSPEGLMPSNLNIWEFIALSIEGIVSPTPDVQVEPWHRSPPS